MTQAELELVAREIRAMGLNSSWDELLTVSKDAVGGLVDVYKAVLWSAVNLDKVSPTDYNDFQNMASDKLAKALSLLTSEAQVNKWKSEALTENNA